jgi:hypothetical protein
VEWRRARHAIFGAIAKAGRTVALVVDRHRSSVTALSFAVLALLIAFTNRPGRYIDDFRFEVAWVPGRTLERYWSLWQPTGGFGGIAGSERNLLPTLVFWVAEAFGASPWIAQRIWQALLLFIAATGAVAVVRFFRPRIGLWHLIAGLAFMLSPAGLGLFRPSPIYAVFAVSPWIVAAVLRGVCGIEPWRWAAVFALSVVFAMPIELPAMIFVFAFLPAIAVLTIRFTREARWGVAALWVARAGLLSVLCYANVLVRSPYAQGSLERRLFITETAEAVAVATSWSEVYRGLGNWLTYFNFGGEIARPNFSDFLDNPLVVAATCLVPLVAMASLLRPSALLARLAVPLAIVSLIVVVGLHPVGDPSPSGRLFGEILDRYPNSLAFRATVKAAWLWALTVAVLFGAVVAAVEHRCRTVRDARLRRPLRSLVVGGAVAMLVAASWPAWTGNLQLFGVDEIPDYWFESVAWLEANPEGQVLVLPGTPQPVYRWGDPGDDILDSVIRRPFLTPNFLTQGTTPTTNNLLWEFQQRLGSEFANQSDYATILRRLGVRYVVIRNDIAWTNPGVLRPASLEPLRNDPGLQLVAQFGELGENTVAPPDADDEPLEVSLRALEAQLHPIEIYDLGPTSLARVVRDDRSVVMAGDGAGWFLAASSGLLDSGAPLAHADASTDDELVDELSSGSPVLITDSNVRREHQAVGSIAVRSPALFPGAERVSGYVDSLYQSPGSSTVAWAPDLAGVQASVDWLVQPWATATQVVDGNPGTAWRVPFLSPPVGQSVTLRLAEAGPIGEVGIQRAVAVSGNLTSAFVSVDGGEPIVVEFDGDEVIVDLDGVVGTELTVGIESVDGLEPTGIGFAEIEIAGYDIQISRDTPSSLASRAEANAELADALAGTSLSFAFEREQTNGTPPLEASLRRRFTVDVPRRFAVTSLARVPAGTDVTSACVPIVRIDGRAIPSIALAPPVSETAPVRFVSCQPVELDAGSHLIEGSNVTLDAVQIDDLDRVPIDPVSSEPAVTRRRGPTSAEIVASSERSGVLITGLSFHEDWEATVGGAEATTFERDGQLAVAVPAGEVLVELDFAPQRPFGLASLVMLAGLLLCALLVVRPVPPLVTPEWVVPSGTGMVTKAALAVVGVVAAFLAGGLPAVGAVIAALALGRVFGWTVPLVAGLGLLTTGTILMLTEADLEQTFQFALDRTATASSIRFGLVALATVAIARPTRSTVPSASASASVSASVSASTPAPPTTTSPERSLRTAITDGWRRHRTLDVCIVGTLGLLVLAIARIGAPDDAVRSAVVSLQAGRPYTTSMAGLDPETALGPLAVMTQAFGPRGVALVSEFMLVVAMGMWIVVGARTSPRRRSATSERAAHAALPFATVAIVAFAGSNHAMALALSLITLGCVFLSARTTAAAVVAGLLVGLAGLALPEAAIAAPVALVFTSVAAGPSRRVHTVLAVLVGSTINAVWWRWIDKEFGLDAVGDALDVGVVIALLVPACLHWLLSGNLSAGDGSVVLGEDEALERQ